MPTTKTIFALLTKVLTLESKLSKHLLVTKNPFYNSMCKRTLSHYMNYSVFVIHPFCCHASCLSSYLVSKTLKIDINTDKIEQNVITKPTIAINDSPNSLKDNVSPNPPSAIE